MMRGSKETLTAEAVDRAMASPGTVAVASEAHRGPWVMLVGPYGQVQHGPVTNVGGDVIVYWDEQQGHAQIPMRYRDQGWCFYEEICSGKYDETGTSAEDGAAHLAMWERMRDAMKQGRRPAMGTIDLDRYYHPEVLRRRALDRPDGMQPVSLDEIMGAELAAKAGPDKAVKRGR